MANRESPDHADPAQRLPQRHASVILEIVSAQAAPAVAAAPPDPWIPAPKEAELADQARRGPSECHRTPGLAPVARKLARSPTVSRQKQQRDRTRSGG